MPTAPHSFKLWDFEDHRIQSLIFKVTEQCNLACNYCYRIGIERLPKRMEMTTICNAIASYAKWLDDHHMKHRPMYLVWHGGEPMICGIEYYRSVLDIQKEFKDFNIYNAFQTNGTLITQKWVDFFKENNIQIGISLDGAARSHNMHRVRITGTSSFDATMRGVRLLRQNSCDYSAICVLSNDTAQYAIENLDFFAAEGFSIVDFIPSFLHNDPSTLDSKTYSQTMIHLYDHWKSHYADQLYVRFLGDIDGRVRNNITAIGCELAGCCGENLSINVFGDVYPCECISTFRELCIGNINNHRFEEMFRGDCFDAWKILVNQVDDDCVSGCPMSDICRGGCFNRRYQGGGKTCGRDLYCIPRYDIMNHIKQKIEIADSHHAH